MCVRVWVCLCVPLVCPSVHAREGGEEGRLCVSGEQKTLWGGECECVKVKARKRRQEGQCEKAGEECVCVCKAGAGTHSAEGAGGEGRVDVRTCVCERRSRDFCPEEKS